MTTQDSNRLSGMRNPKAPSHAGEQVLHVGRIEVAGKLNNLEARIYRCGPPVCKRDDLVVFFHGGAFVTGNLDEADEFLRHVVQADPGLIVLATSYTLAHAAPFPAAMEDAHAVLVWANRNKAMLRWSGKRLLVAGIDAGANLAAVSTIVARDRGGPCLSGQILVMPMLDPNLCSASMRNLSNNPVLENLAELCADGYRAYLPLAVDRLHPYASPLALSRLKNLPPALILAAEIDPLRDEAEQYASRLSKYGVTTTLRYLPALPMIRPGDRNEFAHNGNAHGEIVAFIAGLRPQNGRRSPCPPENGERSELRPSRISQAESKS